MSTHPYLVLRLRMCETIYPLTPVLMVWGLINNRNNYNFTFLHRQRLMDRQTETDGQTDSTIYSQMCYHY